MAEPSFPPVQRGPSGPVPPGNRSMSPLLPLFLLLVYGLYVGVLLIAPIYSDSLSNTLDGVLGIEIRLAVGALLLVLFAIIMIYKLTEKRAPAGPRMPGPSGQAPNARKFKPIPPTGQSATAPSPPRSDASKAPPAKKASDKPEPGPAKPQKQQTIPYPREVEGGIYGDTYITLSDRKVLRLRSLVVEPDYLK